MMSTTRLANVPAETNAPAKNSQFSVSRYSLDQSSLTLTCTDVAALFVTALKLNYGRMFAALANGAPGFQAEYSYRGKCSVEICSVEKSCRIVPESGQLTFDAVTEIADVLQRPANHSFKESVGVGILLGPAGMERLKKLGASSSLSSHMRLSRHHFPSPLGWSASLARRK